MIRRSLPVAALLAGIAAAAPAQQASDVVATVNGTEITLGQMIITRSQLPPQYQQLPPDVLFTGILDQLIQQQVLADTVTEVPARVDYALENERRSLLAGEVVNDMMLEPVDDATIQAAFDETYGAAEPAQEYNASHILVATEEEAKAVLERLEGGEEFEALAKELSTDPGSGANGGDLGWFGAGMMVPPFEEAVAELEAGEVSEPVETQFGFHVIKLTETRTQEPPKLEDVREELSSQIQQKAIEDKLAELQAAAEITRPEEGEIDAALLSNTDLLEK